MSKQNTASLVAPSSGIKDLTEMDWYFPKGINHGHGKPFGSRVLLQLKKPEVVSRGGIHLAAETIETDLWNTEVARVVDMGSLAFKNRETMEYWPEGAWCKPGDFVRVPKYGGSRWVVDVEGPKVPGPINYNKVMFLIVNDLDLLSEVKDPLKIRAFI